MHHVKTFTQLHARKIPSAYKLKRYTRDARSFVEWDRNDRSKGRQDGNREHMRVTKHVPVVMGIARAGTKSDYASDLIDSIPANVT
jgi:hypothetical protein